MDKDFTAKPGRLMDQVRETLRFHHYAYSTEKIYVHWILRYIRFNDRHHPKEMGKQEIERFLSHLSKYGGTVLYMVDPPFASLP